MKDIYYVNSVGIMLNLLEPPYLLQTGNFFDTKWNYESISLSAGGGKITSFRKDLEERKMTLSIINYGKKSYETAVDRFHEVIDYDVTHKTPGKLYVGDMYLRCYLVGSSKSEWESDSSYLDNDITLVVEYPVWIQDDTTQFRKMKLNENHAEYLDFPFDFPFNFLGSTRGVGYLSNEGVSACHFYMIIYGPCNYPRIIISDHTYEVLTKLDTEEYMIVDSRNGTVNRIRNNGVAVNEFDNRNKKSSVFEKIKSGVNLVSWDGSFGFDITLYHERNEPKWN